MLATMKIDMLAPGQDHQVVERVGVAPILEVNSVVDLQTAREPGQLRAVSRPTQRSLSCRRPSARVEGGVVTRPRPAPTHRTTDTRTRLRLAGLVSVLTSAPALRVAQTATSSRERPCRRLTRRTLP